MNKPQRFHWHDGKRQTFNSSCKQHRRRGCLSYFVVKVNFVHIVLYRSAQVIFYFIYIFLRFFFFFLLLIGSVSLPTPIFIRKNLIPISLLCRQMCKCISNKADYYCLHCHRNVVRRIVLKRDYFYVGGTRKFLLCRKCNKELSCIGIGRQSVEVI